MKRNSGFTAGGNLSPAFHVSRFTFHCVAAALLAVTVLAGCATVTRREPVSKAPAAPRPGGYYLDDGPGDNPPANLENVPDATPRIEPLNRASARPYVAMGRSYTPMTAVAPYKARGLATWYGRRYHGKPTSSGELYDMYAMTAAHPTLPIPSYARVTNVSNGKAAVVRINDRGPFVEGRLIDLSYTAAYKLGVLGGATMVEVESIIPGGSGSTIAAAQSPSPRSGQQAGTVTAGPLPDTAKPQGMAESRFSVISPAAAEPLPGAAAATAQQIGRAHV